ncbi:MAG: SDR family oxidoreductase [Planctomycetes bacterium]|nr:SDR family oxidoreductase [Planctomycetota bacterium]
MNLPQYSLTGRVALVTGAGVGIGRAAAILLARAGATVGVHYHKSKAGAEETAHAITEAGGQAHLLSGDLTTEVNANAVVDLLAAKAGRIDILFNNAGSPLKMSLVEMCSTQHWRNVFDVNVTSAFLVTRRAIPHMRANRNGSIINNLSLSIQTGGSGGGGIYAAAKAALQSLTRTLARELAPHIRANAIMPGVIATAHHETFSTPAKMEDYKKQTPLARNGTAEEVAEAVLFLASDASRFMTGAILDINGGRFLR